MEPLRFVNEQGDFLLENGSIYPEIYFPLVNEGHMLSSVTPLLAGDCKMDQNSFLLAPASAETLQESLATRNFWVQRPGKLPWSVTGQSAPQRAKRFAGAEPATVRCGMLWQEVSRQSEDGALQASVLSFVPAGLNKVEILQVTLKNLSAEPMALTPTAAIPLYCRSADNIRDHRHVTSLLHRAAVVPFGLDVQPTLTFDERGHQPGELTYRVWAADENGLPPEGCMPMVRDFVGCGGYDWPEALVKPEGKRYLTAGETAQGGEMVAALRFPQTVLQPEQARRYQVVLAIQDDPTPYLTPAAVETALEETKAYWRGVSGMAIRTQDPELDGYFRWIGIQPTLRRICGCSFLPHHDYGRGGRGWRDLWQDSLALILNDPKAVREDLLCYFAGVRLDGTNATIIGTKPGEFKADRNNIPRVWMDHGFWPLLTVQRYLDETGDYGFLMEQQPYFSDTMAFRGDGAPRSEASPQRQGTVLEHLLMQVVTAFFDVGEHGHIRLRGADWNDGLDMAKERGESVAFTAAYAYTLELLSQLVKKTEKTALSLPAPLSVLLDAPIGEPSAMQQTLKAYCAAIHESGETVTVAVSVLSGRLAEMADWIKNYIRSSEWVGDGADQHWFNSYYDDSSKQVEGLFGDQVRMMLTGQVFCILSGTADREQAAQIIRAADWYLNCPERGGYCLNTDFQETKLDMGRMFGFAYGSKENGAVFCHMAVMYAYALYSQGFPEAGWRVLEQLLSQAANFPKSRMFPGIPEYFDDRGQGMYPYLTGAASWMLLTMQTQVFGVRGEGGALVLEPKLLARQFDRSGTAEILCRSLGRTLRVRYENPEGLEPWEYQLGQVNIGQQVIQCESGKLTLSPDQLPNGETVTVTATLIPREWEEE